MKRFWVFGFGVIFFLAGCGSPSAPRLPESDEDEGQTIDSTVVGFVLPAEGGIIL